MVERGYCGADVGVTLSDDTMVAPRCTVARRGDDSRGWTKVVPPLAVEIAGVGRYEKSLQKKNPKLLESGTRYLWVVGLEGEQRVEVHEPGREMRVAHRVELLSAPEVLHNDVPVDVFFDDALARKLRLRNLMQLLGYDSYESAVQKWKEEGHAEGRAEGIEEGTRRTGRILSKLFQLRFGTTPNWVKDRVSTASLDELDLLAERILTAADIDSVFA